MSRFLNLYMRAMNRRPLVTQALTTGILMAAGDATCQIFIEKKTLGEYDVKRSSRFLAFGTLLLGPSLTKWYGFLDLVVKRPAPVGVFIKIIMDQLIFAPIFLGVFLGTMTLWSTYSTQLAVNKVKQDYTTVLLANYKIWPAAQFINFYIIPLQYRILYVSSVAYFWNVYLAFKAAH